jgi:hypothetical protein
VARHQALGHGAVIVTTQRPFEIGLFTFGEITANPTTGQPIDPAVRLREFIDLARIADDAGLDVFGVGEHHRSDFAIASPPVVLAAIAQATEQIRLTSTVTVLSTADPAKVFEDFTAVDLISGDGPRSPPDEGPTPSRSRCSASTSATTTSCSRRSSSCSCASTGTSG